MKLKINYWKTACITCFLTLAKINAQPLVTYPNGGEKLMAGSSVKITWTGTFLNSEVAIDYTINNWAQIIWLNKSYKNPSENSYTWTVPNTPGTQCMVGVFDNNFSSDISDNYFTIKATTEIDNPLFTSILDIYPNPMKDVLHISNVSGSKLKFKLFDMLGKEIIVEAEEEGIGNYSINKGSLQNGIYTLLISDVQDGAFLRRKIIIE